jgi:hypothetical protein
MLRATPTTSAAAAAMQNMRVVFGRLERPKSTRISTP